MVRVFRYKMIFLWIEVSVYGERLRAHLGITKYKNQVQQFIKFCDRKNISQMWHWKHSGIFNVKGCTKWRDVLTMMLQNSTTNQYPWQL